MLSRRGFLGGAFAAIAINILPPPLFASQPRTWAWLDLSIIEHKAYTCRIVRWCGCRNDGTYFTTANRIWLEDETPEYRQQVIHDGRMMLNSFLESTCDCRLGYWCAEHKFLEPKAPVNYDREEDEDEDEDENAIPVAARQMYEVVRCLR